MQSVLRHYNNCYPTLANGVYIDPSCVLVGDIRLDDDTSIWPLVAARGDVNFIRIGKRSNVQDGSVLHVSRKSAANPNGYPLLIGDDVTVGHKAMLHGCQISNDSLIGIGSIILNNAKIGKNCIVGANTLITENKIIPDNSLVVGSPGKVLRKVTDEEIKSILENGNHYVDGSKKYKK